MELFYMRVGVKGGPKALEDIQLDDWIAELKITIGGALDVDPDTLKLFEAKRDGQWLASQCDEVKAQTKGDATGVLDLLESEPLDETARIRDVFHDMPYRTIHVLVLEPETELPPPLPASVLKHSTTRRKRWRDLDEKLEANKRAKTNSEGTSTCSDESEDEDEDEDECQRRDVLRALRITNVFNCKWYSQERKSVPKQRADSVYSFLADHALRVMPNDASTSDTKLFVAPILLAVCDLFGDAQLEVEVPVQGEAVDAEMHFDFVLTRGKKKVCVAIAEAGDCQKKAAQALVGCEVVAEKTELPVVYGIVTDFVEWEFYQCGEESVLHDSFTAVTSCRVPNYASIAAVCRRYLRC